MSAPEMARGVLRAVAHASQAQLAALRGDISALVSEAAAKLQSLPYMSSYICYKAKVGANFG